MDFGASDIVRGIELALTIYQYGFVEENAAGTPRAHEIARIRADAGLQITVTGTFRRTFSTFDDYSKDLTNLCVAHNGAT